MHIICKNCKKLIDTNKHDFCPKCGSNFNYSENLKVTNHTADYEEYERNRNEQRRNAVENRMNNVQPKHSNTQLETQRRLRNEANKAGDKKNGCIGCFVVAVFLLCAGGTILSESDFDIDEFLYENFGAEEEPSSTFNPELYPVFTAIPDELVYASLADENEEYVPEEEEIYPEYFILAGETAYTEKYALTCTKVSEYENEFFPPDDGYKYIAFDLSVENTTGSERFYYESPACHADGEEAVMATFAGLFLPGRLDTGEVYNSTVVFKVPEEALFFDIYYGNDVVIYTSVADIEGYEYERTQE